MSVGILVLTVAAVQFMIARTPRSPSRRSETDLSERQSRREPGGAATGRGVLAEQGQGAEKPRESI